MVTQQGLFRLGSLCCIGRQGEHMSENSGSTWVVCRIPLLAFVGMRYFAATVSTSGDIGRNLGDSETYLFEELDRNALVHFTESERPLRLRKSVTMGITLPDPESGAEVEGIVHNVLALLGVTQDKYKIENIKPCSARMALLGKDTLTFNSHHVARIAHDLECPELISLFRYPDFFNEEIVAEKDLSGVSNDVEGSPYAESLLPQLGKIYEQQGNAKTRAAGIPVHFQIRHRLGTNQGDAVRALCSALYSSGRVATPNVYHFDFRHLRNAVTPRGALLDRTEKLARTINKSLIRSLDGGTVVVRYGEDDTDSSFDYTVYESVKALLEAAFDEAALQLVLVIPAGKPDLERRLSSAYPRAIISIDAQDSPVASADPEAMMEWLKARALSVGLTPDDELTQLAIGSVDDPLLPSAESLFEAWRQKKLLRETYPQYHEIPLPSETNAGRAEGSSAWIRLNSLIGLHDVKEVIHRTLREHRMRKKYLERGIELPARSLHAVFAGSPGTGKTEVAGLYGEILREEGIIKEGRVFTISGSRPVDFAELFKRAKGSVIFIDEAYGLIGSKSITELIAQMENNRADTVVILAGYADQMEALIRSNPGFASRIGVHVDFPDYSPEELLEIFQLMVDDAGLRLGDQVADAAHDVFSRRGRPDDQGNARYVRKVFENSLGNLLARIDREYPDPSMCPDEELNTILPCDLHGFEAPEETEVGAARRELDSLIGLDQVKEQVEKIVALASVQKSRRDQGIKTVPISLNMSFEGNPGTGKTEVARLVARILREEGILAVGDLIECGRQDLVGRFVGQTAPLVHEQFRRARGSVLFVDEAYSLVDTGNAGYGQEAIDTIIKDMEDFRDEVVVIFAGYPKELNRLFQANPGFPSRVSHHISFPDYTTDELIEILQLVALSFQLKLAGGVAERVEALIDESRGSDTFGNARFIRQLFESALENQAIRLGLDDDPQLLLPEDFNSSELKAQRAPFGFH